MVLPGFVCRKGGTGWLWLLLGCLGTPWECSGSCFALCCPVQFAEDILAARLEKREEQRRFLGCWGCRAALQEEPVLYSMCRPYVPLPSSSSGPNFGSALLQSSTCTDSCVAVSGFLWSLKAWSWILVGDISVSFVLICVVLSQCTTTVGIGCL